LILTFNFCYKCKVCFFLLLISYVGNISSCCGKSLSIKGKCKENGRPRVSVNSLIPAVGKLEKRKSSSAGHELKPEYRHIKATCYSGPCIRIDKPIKYNNCASAILLSLQKLINLAGG